jgi:hypothetical protein
MLLGVEKAKINPQSPKTGFWPQNQYGPPYQLGSGMLYEARKYILLMIKNVEISL